MTLYYVNDDGEWVAVEVDLIYYHFGHGSARAEEWIFLVKQEVREAELSYLRV